MPRVDIVKQTMPPLLPLVTQNTTPSHIPYLRVQDNKQRHLKKKKKVTGMTADDGC
jgi:hypothetical protein